MYLSAYTEAQNSTFVDVFQMFKIVVIISDGQGLSGKKLDELATKASETVYGKGNKYGESMRCAFTTSTRHLTFCCNIDRTIDMVSTFFLSKQEITD